MTLTESSSSLAGPATQLKRHPERGAHERDAVYAIIDEAPICHVACQVGADLLTLPTAHARLRDRVYLHGALANRTLRALCDAPRASATFTLLDGLVLARTAFHHSMNFRCAVIFGRAHEVSDEGEKRAALHALVEHMAPGRMRELAPPTAAELGATRVVCIEIEEASAKRRAGDPLDAPGDLELPVWAGTIPLALRADAPVPDRALRPDQPLSPAAAERAARHAPDIIEKPWNDYLFSSHPARLDLGFVHRFLKDESYWTRDLTLDELRAACAHSICFGVYRGAEQVAFARLVSDRGRFAYLADVFVRADARGRGIGNALVAFVLDHPAAQQASRCLLGTRDAHALYERHGFARTPDGRYMLRIRAPSTG